MLNDDSKRAAAALEVAAWIVTVDVRRVVPVDSSTCKWCAKLRQVADDAYVILITRIDQRPSGWIKGIVARLMTANDGCVVGD